jgi:hypothetical protein
MRLIGGLAQKRSAVIKRIKVALIILFGATAIVAMLRATSPLGGQNGATDLKSDSVATDLAAPGPPRPESSEQQSVAASRPSSGEVGANRSGKSQEQSKESFDYLVREDFFAGFAGDRQALDRAMRTCEEALARDPGDAEAIVWHGSGLVFMSGQAFRKGDIGRGIELWQRGLREMDRAAELEPVNPGVLLVRGPALLEASRHTPNRVEGRALLEKGVADYEKAFELQRPYFNELSIHSRGQLLLGLAEGRHRLGDMQKARGYFERLVNECGGSVYAERARGWLDGKPLSGNLAARECVGCHKK